MATPTRSQMVSTPKNAVNTTPSRPGTSFANKHLAGKSPAVKTPASIHGHAHRISTSSHPTSTPLAASMLPDDILNLNTPSAAALMASMGTTGLTPLPNTQDSLGISTSIHGGSTQDLNGTRNPQLDRYTRLKEVVQTLKQKSAGRGVTRESIKQAAQINGFDADWDNDTNTLTLAGKKYVEVEIVFSQDDIHVVDNTSFKLNFPNEDDAVLQDEDSQILLHNLTDAESQGLAWHELTDFSTNLDYLGQLEHVETSANCFKIIDRLYETFQKIWVEEKKRMKWRHDMHHFCQGNIGEPKRNANGRLGVSSKYWTNGQNFFSKQEPMAGEPDMQHRDWIAKFSVESGSPSIPRSQNWLADEPLISTVTAEDIFHDSATDKPAWLDPETSPDKVGEDGDSMELDQATKAPKDSLNIRFVCRLDPEVLVPLSVAQILNQNSRMFEMHQSDLQTYYHLMDGKLDRVAQNLDRWVRTQQNFDRHGKPLRSTHSYILYAGDGGWAYPIRQFTFTHPRQFAEILPVLRQYTLVSTLLSSVSAADPASEFAIHSEPDRIGDKALVDRTKVTKRTNKSKVEAKLEAILRPNAVGNLASDDTLPIDIKLDTTSSENKSCRIELRIPLSPYVLSRPALAQLSAKAFLIFTIDVLRNGTVEILSIEGVELKDKLDEMKKRLARVVRACENLGITVDWLLRDLERTYSLTQRLTCRLHRLFRKQRSRHTKPDKKSGNVDLAQTELSSIVTIVLESTGTELVVHQEVLCAHSKFAEGCLQSNFVEGQEGRIVLKDEDDEESLRTLISWMYKGKVVLPELPAEGDPDRKNILYTCWLRILRLYVMADKYMMTGIQNNLMARIFQNYKMYDILFCSALILPLMELPTTDKFRLLVIDHAARIFSGVGRSIVEEGVRRLSFKFAGEEENEAWCEIFATSPEFGSLVLQELVQGRSTELSKEDYCDNDDTMTVARVE